MYLTSLVLVFTIFPVLILPSAKFTNINCKELDKTFGIFAKCQLVLVRRGVAALDITLKLLQVPVNNISLTISLFKKANGYRPFLYNTTSNFCDFMKNQKKYPVEKVVVDMVKTAYNLNHTCTYNDDIVLRNMVLTDAMFRNLPLPSGEYMIQVKVDVYNDQKFVVKAYILQNE